MGGIGGRLSRCISRFRFKVYTPDGSGMNDQHHRLPKPDAEDPDSEMDQEQEQEREHGYRMGSSSRE